MKEIISQKHAVLMLSFFIFGGIAITGVPTLQAEQDVWIAIILGMIMAFIIYFVYARILTLFPGNGIYEVIGIVFGKVLGKIISLLYTWYAFFLGTLITIYFSQFIRIYALPETPDAVMTIVIPMVGVYAVKNGIETIGRSVGALFPIIILSMIAVTFLSVYLFDYSHIKPVLYNGLKPVLVNTFYIFIRPFAESVLLLAVYGSLRKKSSFYKVYFSGLIIGGTMVLLVTFRTLLIFGIHNMHFSTYSSYESIGLIEFGQSFQRIEGAVAAVFLVTGIFRGSICLYAAASGLAKVFNIQDYRSICAPIALLSSLYSLNLFSSVDELVEWNEKSYPFYAVPILVILPVIIWLTAEIKMRIAKKKLQTSADADA